MAAPQHLKRFDPIRRRTPQEMHREFAFPPAAKCCGCQGKPHVRAIIMIPLKDAVAQGMVSPETTPTALAPITVPIQESPGAKPTAYLRLSMTYACSRCRRDMEKQLAKAPSWAIVEINEGPDPTNRIILAS